ncbi:MAG TPA: alpha-2-macroglobulin family protein, partial [Microvirga sp.]|nr:alpha-2-macroglobulin family protein [Microvirga sp.]
MIRSVLRRALVAAGLGAALVLGAPAAMAQKTYQDESLSSDAVRIEAQLKAEGAKLAVARPAAQLRRDALAALARGEAGRAVELATGAVAADPADGANWTVYARAARAAEPDSRERYVLRSRMSAAAFMAYQRARTRPDEAAALVLLAETFEIRTLWRSALNAYRASLGLADDAAVRTTYEALREKHGFRITNFRVDSDSASPRACFEFSERLATGKIDFAPYVAVSGAANAAVTAEGYQLCVEGLRHSQRYAFVLREGLPSAVGEALLRSADYEAYVRDRSPQVRFTGRNYVLPRTGQEGLPVVSVNTRQVLVDIYRIGDRSLVPTVRGEDFLAQLSGYSAEEIASSKGVKVWSGTLDTAATLNQDVVTAFPVFEAVGRLEPGVHVMVARPNQGAAAGDADSYDTRATQWFVVSDLGLTAFTGQDGVHVFVRSLAGAEPVGGVEVRLVARNNEVLATKATDASGHAAFDPGL